MLAVSNAKFCWNFIRILHILQMPIEHNYLLIIQSICMHTNRHERDKFFDDHCEMFNGF